MNENLWKLLEMAKADPALLAALEATRKEADPALALCTLATEKGFPITVGELFGEGEEYTCLQICSKAATAAQVIPWMAGKTPMICFSRLWMH